MDVFTLIIMTAIIMGSASAAMFYLRKWPFNVPGSLLWSLGGAALAVSLLLFAFRGRIPNLLSIILANFLLCYGYTLVWQGFRQFLGRPTHLIFTVVFPLVVSPVIFWFTYHDPSLPARSLVVGIMQFVLAALISRELLRPSSRFYGSSQSALGMLYLLVALFYAGYGVFASFALRNADLMHSNVTSFVYILSIFYVLIFTFGIATLISTRLISEFEAAKAEAERASHAKSDFLASMSHEIRTPLHGVIGMLHLLEETPLNGEQEEYVRSALSSSEILKGLVDDVLDLSRVEAGKLELDERIFSPRKALGEVLLPLELLAGQKGLVFSLRFGDVPEYVLGDSNRLCQIALNLAANAIKFTEKGEVSVDVNSTQSDESSARLQIAVRDSGLGLSEADQLTIFEKFAQAESGIHIGGAGLGLAITRSIARLMDGDVRVESQLGAGSVFYADARFRKPETHEIEEYKEQLAQEEASATIPAISPMRVLIADDFPLNRFFLQTIMVKLGHAVRVVANGEEALKAVMEERFDLVFMDIKMPVMDGLEATRRIRALADQSAARVPIVAITAYALKDDRERFLASGMTDYLPKPVSAAGILRVMGKYAPQLAASTPPKAGVGPEKWKGRGADGIHRDYVQDLVDGDQAFLRQFLEMTLENCSTAYEKFTKACEEGNMEAAHRLAHTLKSAVSNYKNEALIRLLAEVERAAKDNNPEALRSLDSELKERFTAFMDEVRTFRDDAEGLS